MGWVPATAEGYAVLGAFIAAVMLTAWLPTAWRPASLIGLGVSYMAGGFWLSRPR